MPSSKHAERRGDTHVTHAIQNGSERVDPLRRFTPTPLGITLQLMGRTVRFETNSIKILDLVLQFFASCTRMSQGDPELTWRIVSESSSIAGPGSTSTFSDADLSFVSMGQRSFLAMDAETRSGIAFLAEGFAEVLEPRFMVRSPLEFLFYMTVASMGLTSLSAACVGFGAKGILLLGEPNSGKTTASYVAARLGMELLADHVVFLERAASGVRAWGDPFPVMFRPESLRFFPELRNQVRTLSYDGVTFCLFDKSKLQSPQEHSIAPLCSILLQRAAAAEPRLVPMVQGEFSRYLAASLLFRESDRFRSQRDAVFAGLEELPSYRLSYGEDPATAATFVRDLLVGNAREGGR
jgi:hypothetical protein